MRHLLSGTCTLLLALCTPLAFAGEAGTAEKGVGLSLNDAEIIQVLHITNGAEIKAAQVAKDKAQNQEVKQFAEQMIKDHKAMDVKVGELQRKMNIRPQDSALSTGLQAKANTAIAGLKPLSGEALDEAYILSQVSMHGDVKEAIRDSLLPSAKNAELKALIQEAAPKIDMHLQHAKQLQEQI